MKRFAPLYAIARPDGDGRLFHPRSPHCAWSAASPKLWASRYDVERQWRRVVKNFPKAVIVEFSIVEAETKATEATHQTSTEATAGS